MDGQHDPETAMQRFEEFARKVFYKKKSSAEREGEFPAREPADDPPPETAAKDAG